MALRKDAGKVVEEEEPVPELPLIMQPGDGEEESTYMPGVPDYVPREPEGDIDNISPDRDTDDEYKWWQYRNQYPVGEEEEEPAPPDVIDVPDYMQQPGYPEPVVEDYKKQQREEEEKSPSYLNNAKRWFNNQKKLAVDVVTSNIEEVRAEPIATAKQIGLTSTPLTLPFSKKGREAYKKTGTFLWDKVIDLTDEVKRIVGFWRMTGKAEELGPSMHASTSAGRAAMMDMLEEEEYVARIENRPKPPMISQGEWEEYKQGSVEGQKVYQKVYNETGNRRKALVKALDAMEEFEIKGDKIFTSNPSGNYVLPFTEDAEEVWSLAEGYRYTHDVVPEEAHRYWDYIESGMDPQEAGELTERPFIEMAGEFTLDPWLVIPVDDLIFGPIVKTVGKGLGRFSRRAIEKSIDLWPNGPIAWAARKTATTQANYAGRAVGDAVRYIKGYADEAGETITPKFLGDIFDSPPDELVEGMTQYYYRELARSAKFSDEITDVAERFFTGDNWDEALGIAKSQLRREGVDDITDTLFNNRAVNNIWEDFVDGTSSVAYGKTLTEAADNNKILNKAFLKNRPVVKLLLEGRDIARSSMVDMWIGMRPSWNLYNKVDNLVRIFMSGVNPTVSLKSLAQRHVDYTPDIERAVKAADELPKINLFNFRRNEEVTELLDDLAPQSILESFAETGEREAPRSIFKAFGPSNEFIQWNNNVAGRIEKTARARSYFHHFFDYLDEGWEMERKRFLTGDNPLSDEAVDILSKKLDMKNPTVEKVSKALHSVLDSDEFVFVKPEIGDDLAETLFSVPDGIKSQVKNRLRLRAGIGPDGPRAMRKSELKEIFEDGVSDVVDVYDQSVDDAVNSLDDTLPPTPETVDEAVKILIPKGQEETLDGVVKAINDFPVLGKRASLENTKMREEAFERITEMRKRGASPTEIGEMWDEWAFETNPNFWDGFLTKQEHILDDLFERLNNQVDTPVPRQYFDRYMEAARSLSGLNVRKYQGKKTMMNILRSGIGTKPIRDWVFETTTKKWDEIYQTTQPQLIDEMHRSLVGIKNWLRDEGVDLSGSTMQGGLVDVGWDSVGARIDNISKEAWDNMQPALREMKDWYEYTLTRRNTPFSEVEFTEEEITWLSEHADELTENVRGLVGEAQDRAIRKTNNYLFDYETSRNAEKLLGQVIPFVRYPTRNMPFWARQLTSNPKLWTTVVKAREAQAKFNKRKGLARRLWYTVPIPYSEETLEMFGIAENRQLRFNPWSFLSMMSTIPGSTPFQMRKLEGLSQEMEQAETPRELPGKVDVMTELAGQMGMTLRPGLDFMLGSMGLLGEDWYPRGFTGGMATTANWIVREITDYEADFSIEKFMWRTIPTVVNQIFGGTELSMENINAEKFEEWITGRELETVITRLDEDVVREVEDITPTDAQNVVREMEPERERQLRNVMEELIKAEPEQQLASLENMGEEEKAIFMLELQKVAQRRAVRNQALRALLGHFTVYTKSETREERMAAKTRYERRKKKESMQPGQERRDEMGQWYEEHPKYGFIQGWRFGDHQWAETELGEEIEEWDSTISDYKHTYYDYNESFQEKKKKIIEETSRNHPLDTNRLDARLGELYQEKDEYTAGLNKELRNALEAKLQKYIKENPNDEEGIRRLKEGYSTEIYVGTHLTDEDREKLSTYREKNPEDEEGYNRLFRELYEKRREESPPLQEKKVPGLDEGIKMNLEWTPVGDEDYTEEEIRQFLVGDLLRELYEDAPDKDDYDTYEDWESANNEFMDNLPDKALETDQAQKQLDMLVEVQGMSEEEAEETIRSWYTEERLYDEFQENDTVYEALNSVYEHRWENEADEEYFDEILPIKEEAETLREKADRAERAGNMEEAQELEDEADDLFAEYMFRKEDLASRYTERPATEFIRYIMDEYPGRWTALELRKELEGMTVPGYFNRLTLRKSGSEAVTAHIKNYYYDLSTEDKMKVRQTFGPKFSDILLEQDEGESLDIRLRGSWLDSLVQMFGEDLDWTSLPGVDIELKESQMAEANEKAGLPKLTPQDFEEFEQAQKLNRRYWEMKKSGDEGWRDIEENPLWQKYFEGNTAKSYFWDIYYDKIPPFGMSEDMRGNTLVQFILDKDVRTTAATNSDYDRASKFMMEWYTDHQDDIRAAGLNPDDYELVRRLNKEFFSIPEENNRKRRAFLEQHPILIKYWEASSSGEEDDDNYDSGYGGGGGGYSSGSYSSSSSQNYKDLWTAFRKEVGQSLPSVIRMLNLSQQDGKLPSATENFLRSLHDKLDVDMEFEEWLSTLWYYWQKYGVSGSKLNVPSLSRSSRSFERPRYSHRTRGIRRIEY